jgi:hypothetical protein
MAPRWYDNKPLDRLAADLMLNQSDHRRAE